MLKEQIVDKSEINQWYWASFLEQMVGSMKKRQRLNLGEEGRKTN